LNNQKVPRLIDIAALAGVSIGTVDRVINKRGRVAKETREKVIKIADELGYKPNIFASGLSSSRTFKNILVFLPERESDPYWSEVYKGCQIALSKMSHQNVNVTYKSFDLFSRQDFVREVERLDLKGIDGVLIAPIFLAESKALMDKIEKNGTPYVIINTMIERSSKEFVCYVGPNSYQSGRLAARLMSLHCPKGSKILLLPLDKDFKNAQHYLEKEKGFRDWFFENDETTEITISEFEDFEDIDLFQKFIDDQVLGIEGLAGIYTGSSRISAVASYLHEKGIKDIRLIGYDSTESNMIYLKNGQVDYLISQNPKLMGCMGMYNLRDHLVFKMTPKKVQYLPLDILLPENVNFHSGNYYLPDEHPSQQ
jgi:LacI family transcriptional regulator